MKRLGHLNRDIARVLARMGHTDSLVIADCGLPLPQTVECIDVSLALGDPALLHVLETVLADLKVERAMFAEEVREHNRAIADQASSLARSGIGVDYVSHQILKRLTHAARAAIRTGEATPYANVILYSGVIFDSQAGAAPPCK
jgi:D-ribose pyranase